MATKMDLDDIIADQQLSMSFHTYLDANYMAVSYELWLDIINFETAASEQRREKFNAIYKKFFEKGCPSPMSLPAFIVKVLTENYVPNYRELKLEPLPLNIYNKAKEELWMLLQWTCIPSFLLSPVYQDFKNGLLDTTKTTTS